MVSLVAVGGVFFLLISFFFSSLSPVSKSSYLYEFRVSRGESLDAIASRLEREGIVRSGKSFVFYAILMSDAHRFQPGIFPLNTSMGVPEIVARLTSPFFNAVRVTVLEGMTMQDIDELLRTSSVGAIHDSFAHVAIDKLALEFPFLAQTSSLEGFLFPDTYLFPSDVSRMDVARIFLRNFEKKVMPIFGKVTDLYGAVSLASILEREVKTYEDRRIVAGILLKRLSVGMPLQVDASVIYGKCSGKISMCSAPYMLRSDTTFSSKYNTYLYSGLPPTPISNSGLLSLSAALNPQSSRYWYYLSDPKTSKTYFSETLDEHNTKRARYLSKQSDRGGGGG